MLRALILALHYHAARNVSKPNSRIGFIHVLTARTACTECVYTQVGLVNLDLFDAFHLRHDRDRAGRGVDSPLGFGFGHALHAVSAGFKLELLVDVLAFDAHDKLLVAAVLTLALGNHL